MNDEVYAAFAALVWDDAIENAYRKLWPLRPMPPGTMLVRHVAFDRPTKLCFVEPAALSIKSRCGHRMLMRLPHGQPAHAPGLTFNGPGLDTFYDSNSITVSADGYVALFGNERGFVVWSYRSDRLSRVLGLLATHFPNRVPQGRDA